MAIQFLFQHRSVRRGAALLAAGAIVLGTVPARADDEAWSPAKFSNVSTSLDELLSLALRGDANTSLDELLSLAVPSDTGASRSEDIEDVPAPGVLPEFEPAEPRAAAPYVAVRLEIVNTQEVVSINVPLDGQLGPQAAREIAHLFRCRRTGRQGQIAPGALAMLARVATQWPDRSIQIVSGFRAPPFGAPQSKHFKGNAIDLRIPGVRTSRLRDFIWREHHEVGVGFYAKENFVHMDWRPGERDRAWTGSEEGGAEEYDPRWARKARRVLPSRGTMVASTSGLAGIGKQSLGWRDALSARARSQYQSLNVPNTWSIASM
jgi:uncharacterized protein YcbK (DUF882 family)